MNQDIAQRALALIPALAAAEKRLLDAQEALASARQLLADEEARAIRDGLEGKNEQERDAHLRHATRQHIARVLQGESEYRAAVSAKYLLEQELKVLRAILVTTGGSSG